MNELPAEENGQIRLLDGQVYRHRSNHSIG
jgi:hypothetical protein